MSWCGSWYTRVLLAALSGWLAWLAGSAPFPLTGRAVLQGAVFGALVLVPFLGPGRGRAVRAAALLAGSVAIQLTALNLALHLATLGPLPFAITAAAIAGALLVAALAQAAIPLRATWPLWPLAAAAGLLGGLVLSFPPAMAAGRLPGLVAWQALVWAVLYATCGQTLRRAGF